MEHYRAYTGRQAMPENTDNCRFFLLHDSQVAPAAKQLLWKKSELPDSAELLYPVGEFQGKTIIVGRVSSLHSGSILEARDFLASSTEPESNLYSHATQLLRAEKEHAFCGRCGSATEKTAHEWAMLCTSCEVSYYPRISPCIIVLVKRGNELLLVQHQKHLRQNPVFTTVAGFMEPGETAEEAVYREVLEETGIKVKNVEYHFSQSWPFPHSLMLGFHAEYESGEIVLEEKELSAGGWFKADEMPEIPPAFTIARRLIDIAL
ncbi:NAD(+) diphosphatase [Endozoicomonas sp. OPT23]|uniref:NAD(+) diphosphatase n=1 Tax=Endozoicomonas sp. OPT23 TaxID=2072845 RepID=UPI00129B7405|nr:NAD(+) diphosphatase [Endozoicomonas sp. OPT23]MRI34166.1 NAD(+) diphosphatase [Endozoicomonas sp. OPT23]